MIEMILGAILAAIGTIMTVWGHNQQQTIEYKWCKAFEEYSETIGIDAVFYIGLILLIIGIIVLIFSIVHKFSSGGSSLLQMNSTNKVADLQSRNKYRCAKCGALMDESMKFCPDCGANEIMPDTPLSTKNQSQDIFCGNCGAKISNSEVFCHECGNKLQYGGDK